jgi:hypothetical protein
MPASTASGSSANPPVELDRATLVVAGVVMLGAVMSLLDTTVVNVAIDRLAVDFHSSLTRFSGSSPATRCRWRP